jgi:hypothetical protein
VGLLRGQESSTQGMMRTSGHFLCFVFCLFVYVCVRACVCVSVCVYLYAIDYGRLACGTAVGTRKQHSRYDAVCMENLF